MASAAISVCGCWLLLLFRLPTGSTVKSNDISTISLSQKANAHLSREVDCPVLPPCRCVQPPHSIHQGPSSVIRVTCHPVQTSRRRVLRFSKTSLNLSFDHLSLAYAGLIALPASVFHHIKVKELDLQGNSFGRVGSRSLDGLKTLTSLNLAWSNISRLSMKAFRHLRLLRNLSLAENRLRRLNSFIFRDLRSLETLSLAGNKLTRLEPDLFLYQSNLQHLDMSYCDLGRLPWTLFSGLWSLQSLDLRGNQLHHLASHMFSELISLHSLLLADNALTTLDQHHLYGLEHLRILRVDNNRLRWIDMEAFKSTPLLTELDLGENLLNDVVSGTLAMSVSHLRQLSLDGNRFKEIPGDVAGLTDLRHLDVSYNLIQTVDVCLLEQLADRLHYLNVRENPFHCDEHCSLQTRLRRVYFRLVKRWVIQRQRARRHGLPLTTSPFVPGKCWTPLELRGSSVVSWKCPAGDRRATFSSTECNHVE